MEQRPRSRYTAEGDRNAGVYLNGLLSAPPGHL